MFKNYLVSLGYFFIILILSTLILTIFNYFNILNSKIINILKLLIPIIAIFIASFKLGTKSKQRGYLEGLKIAIIIILTFTIIVLLVDKLTIKSLLYYTILILTAMLSSMIGINRKKT